MSTRLPNPDAVAPPEHAGQRSAPPIVVLETRVVEFDALPRYGGKPVPKGRPRTWKFPWVTLRAEDGTEGHATAYGPHGDGPAMAEILHEVYAEVVLGKNPLDTDQIWQKLSAKTRHLYHLSDALVGVLDVAVWDLRGKLLGQSIAAMLGPIREAVPAYRSSHLFEPSTEEICEEVLRSRAEEFRGFKLQFRDGLDRDLPRLRAVREAVGFDFPLMQDSVAGYGYADALALGRVLDELNFHWYEEPVSDYDTASLVALAKALKTPILAGETLPLAALEAFANQTRLPMLRGDVLLKSGITGLHRAFALARDRGLNLEVHSAGSPLLDVANLHVAGANANGQFFELHHPIFHLGLKNTPLTIDATGLVHVPTGPGLGVEIDWDWVDAHTISHRLTPYRPTTV
jgi:L-alanine-DL-glutamate epimerase-like enolase superfamily enzyme